VIVQRGLWFYLGDKGSIVTISGNQLLSALGSGIVPNGAVGEQTRHDQGLSFDEVLSKVQRGEPSEIGIQIGKEVPIESMTLEMQQRAGWAADLAAINGIQRAVVDLGESIVRLDVSNRMIEAQIEPSGESVVDRIDGYVSVRPARDASGSDEESGGVGGEVVGDSDTGLLGLAASILPARIVRNTSLVDVLAAHDR